MLQELHLLEGNATWRETRVHHNTTGGTSPVSARLGVAPGIPVPDSPRCVLRDLPPIEGKKPRPNTTRRSGGKDRARPKARSHGVLPRSSVRSIGR